MKEGKDLRYIKRDATKSKVSKKFDYFLNKILECLPKTNFYQKLSKSVKNSFEIRDLD